jgi:hypothetical protein
MAAHHERSGLPSSKRFFASARCQPLPSAIPVPSLSGGLEVQIEELSTKGLRFARDNNFDEAGLAALRLAIDEARRAIDVRPSIWALLNSS